MTTTTDLPIATGQIVADGKTFLVDTIAPVNARGETVLRFVLRSPTGLHYIATEAFIGDADTMKLMGGRNGYTLARDRNGGELHISKLDLLMATGLFPAAFESASATVN